MLLHALEITNIIIVVVIIGTIVVAFTNYNCKQEETSFFCSWKMENVWRKMRAEKLSSLRPYCAIMLFAIQCGEIEIRT